MTAVEKHLEENVLWMTETEIVAPLFPPTPATALPLAGVGESTWQRAGTTGEQGGKVVFQPRRVSAQGQCNQLGRQVL